MFLQITQESAGETGLTVNYLIVQNEHLLLINNLVSVCFCSFLSFQSRSYRISSYAMACSYFFLKCISKEQDTFLKYEETCGHFFVFSDF